MEKKIDILIPDRFLGSPKLEKSILGKKFNVILGNCSDKSKLKTNYLQKAKGILAWHDIHYDKKMIDKLKSCKCIVRVGVGYDSVDIEYAAKKNIYVFNVPDYGIDEVADHTIGLFLNLARKLTYADYRLSENLNDWHWSLFKNNQRINKLTFGVLGLGRIGSAVALRAKSFGCNVVFYDKYLKTGIEKSLGLKRYNNLNQFLKIVDVLSLHLPKTDETVKIINKKNINKIKKNVILINTARGELIDEDALVKKIKSKFFYGIGLDVLFNEPPNHQNNIIKLWKSKKHNILLSPHGSFYTEQSYSEMRSKAAKTLKDFIINKKLNNCINLKFF